MSIVVSGRCSICGGYWVYVQIFDRKEYESEGFICDYCTLPKIKPERKKWLKKSLWPKREISGSIESRFEILDL